MSKAYSGKFRSSVAGEEGGYYRWTNHLPKTVEGLVKTAKDGNWRSIIHLIFEADDKPFDILPMQQEWLDLMESEDRLVILAPPESGKTTVILAWILHCLAKDTSGCGAIVCNRLAMATKRMHLLQELISLNDGIHAIWPHLKKEARPQRNKKWDTEAMIIEREKFLVDYTIQAVPAFGPIEGSRLNFIIMDDLADFLNSYSEAGKKRLLLWVTSTLLPRAKKSGAKVIVIGVPFEATDLYYTLEQRGFKVVKFPALTKAGKMLMPSLFTQTFLEGKRKELGRKEFARQYLLDSQVPEDDSDFEMRDIKRCIDRDRTLPIDPEPGMEVITGVDLAVKTALRHDKTCLFTIGIDSDGVKTILDITVGRWKFGVITEKFFEVGERYPMTTFWVEDVGAQDYIIQHVKDQSSLKDRPSLKVRSISPNRFKHSSVTGIPSMAVDFEKEKWVIPNHAYTRTWINELLAYNGHDHTGDTLMASWLAICAAKKRRGYHISTA